MRDHAAAVPRYHGVVTVRNLFVASGSRIMATELARVLEPDAGRLVGLKFNPAGAFDPDAIGWEASDAQGNIVGGTLMLHTAVTEEGLFCWVEVIIERRPIDLVAARVAARYMQRTEGGGLVEVDDGEEEHPNVEAAE